MRFLSKVVSLPIFQVTSGKVVHLHISKVLFVFCQEVSYKGNLPHILRHFPLSVTSAKKDVINQLAQKVSLCKSLESTLGRLHVSSLNY